MTTVLVTCGGGFQGLGLVRALRCAGGIRTIVCDTHSDNPTHYACHEYLVSPQLADQAAFDQFLLAAVESAQVDFVFPATALELRTLARLHPALQALGATAAVTPQPTLDRLMDKRETHHLLLDAGLPTQSLIDPDQHDYVFPLIGKPRSGWGGRGTVILTSRESARRILGGLDAEAYVWSRRYDEFKEYSADFAIGIDRAVSPVVVRQRMRTSGGFAVISASVQDPLLHSLFTKLAETLARAGGLGCFNAQAIVPANEGKPFVSDINPRLGTSATHALAEGVNLPAFFVSSVRGEQFPASTRTPVKTVRLLEDLVIPKLEHRPRGLVFDLDDTLVDHKRWLFRKMEQLYPVCFRDHVEETAYRLAVAQLIDEREWPRLIDRLLELLALPPTLRAASIEAYRDIEVATPFFDDVESTISALTDAGIKLAILTDNPPQTQLSKIRHAEALSHFDAVVFSREFGCEKPDRSGFDAAATALSLAHGDLVMVGDSWFRDGVGAIGAGYAHALVIRRNTLSCATAASLAETTPAKMAGRIHALPDLISVRHACMDAPS